MPFSASKSFHRHADRTAVSGVQSLHRFEETCKRVGQERVAFLWLVSERKRMRFIGSPGTPSSINEARAGEG